MNAQRISSGRYCNPIGCDIFKLLKESRFQSEAHYLFLFFLLGRISRFL